MKHSVGLDVSVKETAICIVDEAGKVVRESKVATEPQAIIAFLNGAEFEYARIGLEAGPLSQWLVKGVAGARVPVICVETPHMKGGVKGQQGNKNDPNNARGVARRRAPPHEGGAEGAAGKQERPQRCPRDRADDASRAVQAGACEDPGQPAKAHAADQPQAAA